MNKLIKKFIVICSLLTMIVTVCNVNVKINAEEIKKNWISYVGSSMATASGYFSEGEANKHDYEFMIGNSSAYSDVTAVIVDMPEDVNFAVSVTNETTGRREVNYKYSQYKNKVIYYIERPDKASKYLIQIINSAGYYHRVYSIKIDTIYKRGTYKAKFNPSTLINPGKGKEVNMSAVYSNIATLDLRKVTTIPDSAELTAVSVSGTMSKSLGNTKMELTNRASGITQEATLFDSGNTTVLFNDFRNSLDTVKTIWSVDYYSYAALASTFKNTEISITYRYDQYADF